MATHDAGLRLVAQLVKAGATDDEAKGAIEGFIPAHYRGNLADEVDNFISSARQKGFDQGSGQLPLDELIAREIEENLSPLVYTKRDGFLRYENGHWPPIGDREIDRAAKGTLLPHLKRSNQVSRHLAAVRTVLSLNTERPEFGELNNLICMKNGTLNVLTGELLPHRAEDELRFQLPFEWAPEATCPLYEKHVRHVFQDDEKRIALFDEFAGLLLTPDMSFQKSLWLVGAGGSGKSSLLQLIRAAHDPKAVSVTPLNKLGSERYLTDVVNKLVCISFDVQTRSKVFGETFIRITGQDPVTIRRLYEEVEGNVQPTVRLIGSMNLNMPSPAGARDALARRLILLDCGDPITSPSLDHGTKLRKELPGILVRWVRAYSRLRERGHFDIPESSKARLETYLYEQDPFDTFFIEELIIDKSAKTLVSEIHRMFNEWAMVRGEATLSANVIGRKLHEAGALPSWGRREVGGATRSARTVGIRLRGMADPLKY